MPKVEVRISGAPEKEKIQSKLAFSAIVKGDVIIQSRLESDATLNDHLVWLWGMLKNERRFLKTLQAEGARISCHCTTSKREIHLLPNAAEMIHLLGIELIIETKSSS
ncbi:MAG: hypothetical protein CXR30_19415 [Geobacter sp.]|nr:MAG: hypothetical protein CXR30_19415 [Geobacter sp.]